MLAVHDDAASAGLLVLLGVWAALLLGSVVANWISPSERTRTATRLRIASSAALVLSAWTWYLVARPTPGVAGFAFLLAVGMTFGFLGDVLLANILSFKQGFLAGMGAFALGHGAYIAAILSLTPRILWAVAGAALFVGLSGWYLVVYRAPKGNDAHDGNDAHGTRILRWAALPYALLLATTAGVAAGLALQMPIFLPLAIGGTLFLISDLLVAGERFGSLRFPHSGDAVWLTYGPAQALIVYAVNSALLAGPAFW